ncbi:receptor-like protein kinase THESEUS 1 [Senna tora]|uniref:Receptor-like protein kinase THESEUS 1 n=1 Tax=Senna tora TaxID=362788 RepID=A0A834TKZ2_9FABA|nr:receptor-like protein kinase THESEUS 1 [Senna tora]
MSKEYAMNLKANTFTLTFVPSKDSTVFVNAIEVVSIPNEVFSFQQDAIETMYRLNMGGFSVSPQNDTLHRFWEKDDDYVQDILGAVNVSVDPFSVKSSFDVNSEIAPKQVYATAKALKNEKVSNLTWVFLVNPNFKYILRMHFCDIISRLKHQLYFDVYVNSEAAVKDLDLSALTYDVGVPYFIDFVSKLNPSKNSSDMLTVRIERSKLEEESQNAIMNGLEIMKISNEARSLDGFSSAEAILPNSHSKIRNLVIAFLCSVLVASVFLALICFLYPKKTKGSSGELSLSSSGDYCRIFTLQEIKDATNNFGEESIIGVGGFGKVYMGKLEDGSGTTKVAFKRANPESKQGLTEFQNEIVLLSKLHHRHLVSLIGYSNEEGGEMILAYEYMENGSLSNHLYGPNMKMPPLSWKQRIEICIGAARGLHYLHTGTCHGKIIHRDVKTSNILLDESFVAKVSDFGISRKGPFADKSHVSTAVKGSFGYFDPDYFRTRHLTEKSDVFSFGVVLVEVVCGRPALDHSVETNRMNLARWALSCEENGELYKIIDRSLIGEVKVDSFNKVWEVAKKCLEENRMNRPSMGYVMCSLEHALQLDNNNFNSIVLGATTSDL